MRIYQDNCQFEASFYPQTCAEFTLRNYEFVELRLWTSANAALMQTIFDLY